MREIKFRGKRQQGGKWIYGSYISRSQQHYLYDIIIDDKNRKKAVMRESVGQYINLKDKDNFKIYKGDIVKVDYHSSLLEIKWSKRKARWIATDGTFTIHLNKSDCEKYFKVVGTKYENPELLKGEK